MEERQVALYIHIPFCVRKCVYCDFASYPGRQDVWHAYYDALIGEQEGWKETLSDAVIPTVFLGGGTPSLPPAEETERLLDAVRRSLRVTEDAEITMEANPGTLDAGKLRTLRRAGVNRLSLGVQALDDGSLRALGRIHTAEQVVRTVALARDAGFENISMDLMYGLPGQTREQWRRTLEDACMLGPEHISAYSLIVEEGTALYDDVVAGCVTVPDDDEVLELQRYAVRTLAEHGYERYEISNYAQPGYRSKHNMVYWRGGEYLGIGCAAHSLIANERFENPRVLERYLAGERGLERIVRTDVDVREETLMLQTRMCEGLDLRAWRRRFGFALEERKERELTRFRAAGLIELVGGRLKLTERGMEVQDAVVLELME